jgi:hypothetical protein
MPLWRDGGLRKRWRYVAAFGEQAMLCAARAQVGPFRQSFWVVWDRERRQRHAHTSFSPLGHEVVFEGQDVSIESRSLRAGLRLAESRPIEAVCPSGRGWGWTRKRAGMVVSGSVEVDGRRLEVTGLGVDDESAGYHERRTSWRWSAGVGRDRDGREVAWNLVEGINDPRSDSERSVWVDGDPYEPAPVSFDGLDAIESADGARLGFAAECERRRRDNFLLLRSSYRLRFGTFAGSIGDLQVEQGLGVMETHDARW